MAGLGQVPTPVQRAIVKEETGELLAPTLGVGYPCEGSWPPHERSAPAA